MIKVDEVGPVFLCGNPGGFRNGEETLIVGPARWKIAVFHVFMPDRTAKHNLTIRVILSELADHFGKVLGMIFRLGVE